MRARSLAALALLIAAAVWALLVLLQAGATASAYPEYSSLRSDPDGARLLYESFSRIGGLRVERSFVPWKLFADEGATVLLLGIPAADLRFHPESFFEGLEKTAARGNRIVLALVPSRHLLRPGTDDDPPLTRRWHVRVELEDRKALRLRLAAGAEWTAIEQGSIVERRFGPGSVVLVADGRLFSNRAQIRAANGDRLAAILGPHSRIIFEESHLGVVEGGSIVKLALRYNLHGFLIGFLLWVAIYLWKNASSFPPRGAMRESSMVAGRTSLSGLVTLLRRNVPEREVARLGFSAWRKTAERSYSRAEIDRAARVMESAAGPAATVLERVRAELPPRGKGAV